MSALRNEHELTSRFARCVAFDVAAATGGQLDAMAAELDRVASWVDAQRARVGAARRALEDAAAGRANGPPSPPRRRARPMPGPGSGSGASSRRDDAAAEGARRCPSFVDALAAGRISADHLAALGRVRNHADVAAHETALLDAALARPADDFAVWLRAWDDARDTEHGTDLTGRRRIRRRVTFHADEDGRQVTRAVLGPVEHARLSQALHDAAEVLWRNGDRTSTLSQRLADALVALVTGAATRTGEDAPASGATDVVLRRPGAATILALLHDAWMRAEADRVGIATTLDGVALTPTELRIALCEANVLPVVLGGDGQIVDVGRARRHATDAQWRALLARDGGCVVLGCPAPAAWTVVHHCRPWEDGGPTDLANLCLFCSRHHRELHQHGWTATVEGGVVRVTTVAGHEVPTRNRNGPVPVRGPTATPRAA